MCLSLCVYIRCMFVHFWKVIPKFGIPGSIKIFNILNAFRDFSLVPFSNVLVYHIWIMMIALRTWVFYDLVMCYKIYNNLVDLPFESFFTKPARSYSIRGHPCILRSKHLPHHAFRAHFFTERVIPIWNHLPHDVVTSLNITVFRTRLRSVDLSPFCMLYPSHV